MCIIPSTSFLRKFILHTFMTTNIGTATPESMTTTTTTTTTGTDSDQFHKLSHRWTLWAHLPHDTNWAASSYKKIYEFDTAEQAIAIFEVLPPKLVMNCMLLSLIHI